MASAAREYRYAHREFSTNGSLARDLDWAVLILNAILHISAHVTTS